MRDAVASVGPDQGTGGGRRGVPRPVKFLALAQVVIGLSISLFALFPPLPTTPRALEAAAAAAALVLAAVSLLLLPRLMPWAITVSVCATMLVLDVLAAGMPTAQGQVLAALGLTLLCVFAAQYLPPRSLAVVVAGGLAGYVLALVVDRQIPGLAVYATAIVAVVAGITAQVSWLESRLLDQALHDPLTSALNRRGLDERAPAARDLAARSGRPTTVVMVDIDAFKAFNDTHGHAAGDDALVALVIGWRRILRSSDLVGRFGGDEFVLVLPGSSVDDARRLLARLREGSPLVWTSGEQVWLPGEDLFARLAEADADLYRAKHLPVIDLAAAPPRTVVDLGATVPVRAPAQDAVGGDGQPR